MKYPNSCGNGNKQSPINIISKEALFQKELGEISFYDYNKVIDWNVTNNGITSFILFIIFIDTKYNLSNDIY